LRQPVRLLPSVKPCANFNKLSFSLAFVTLYIFSVTRSDFFPDTPTPLYTKQNHLKMRSFILAGLSLLTLGAVAQPLEARQTTCMTTANAQRVAQNFRALIHEEFNKTLALTALDKNFVDYSGEQF
jgi:hypothetical protein